MAYDFKSVKLDDFVPILGGDESVFNFEEDKKLINSYFSKISPFIYTDMVYINSTEESFRSRLQVLLSRTLYRSLFLHKGCIESLNQDNFPTYFSILKSLMEVMALLGYILYSLKNIQEQSKLDETLERLTLGNKPAGDLSVGFVDAINVLTMFQKTDKMLEGQNKDLTPHILESTYGYVCNFGHINFNSHAPLLHIDEQTGVFTLLKSFSNYKVNNYMNYSLGLIFSIQYIEAFVNEILSNKKVNHFVGLDCKPLFLS